MDHLFMGLPVAAQGGQPVVPEPLKARVVASALRRWATANNLSTVLPGGTEEQLLDAVAPLTMSEVQTNFLRGRGISSIAFNDESAKVMVYTRKRVTKEQLKHLPNSAGGCEIEYPSGYIDDLNIALAEAQGAKWTVVQTAAGANHYACGSSISPGNVADAGTLGCLVRDADGALYGLSNNHVTGACSHSPVMLPILAPGVIDVAANTLNPFTLGLHQRTLPMRVGTHGNINIFENRDAAIFRIIDEAQVSSMQGSLYDTPDNVIAIADNMLVEKVGRTTQHTTGAIVGRELMPIAVGVGAPTYRFQGQVIFGDVWVVHGDNDLFSDAGDSGSLVVSRNQDGTKSAVGLIFAGGPDSSAPGGKKSLILPLQPILDELHVTLVHGHNV